MTLAELTDLVDELVIEAQKAYDGQGNTAMYVNASLAKAKEAQAALAAGLDEEPAP